MASKDFFAKSFPAYFDIIMREALSADLYW